MRAERRGGAPGCRDEAHLDAQALLELLAGGKERLGGGKLQVPELVLHPGGGSAAWWGYGDARGGRRMRPGASTHLLLNFSGYFSRMTWKRCAMEASCGGQMGAVWRADTRPCCASPSPAAPSPTHHPNGEVVVDDLIGHGVTSLGGAGGQHPQMPAVHLHHAAALDVLQDLHQVLPIVACGWRWGRHGIRGAEGDTGLPTSHPTAHLHPSAGIAPGRCRCPGAERPRVVVGEGWLCLQGEVQ